MFRGGQGAVGGWRKQEGSRMNSFLLPKSCWLPSKDDAEIRSVLSHFKRLMGLGGGKLSRGIDGGFYKIYKLKAVYCCSPPDDSLLFPPVYTHRGPYSILGDQEQLGRELGREGKHSSKLSWATFPPLLAISVHIVRKGLIH